MKATVPALHGFDVGLRGSQVVVRGPLSGRQYSRGVVPLGHLVTEPGHAVVDGLLVGVEGRDYVAALSADQVREALLSDDDDDVRVHVRLCRWEVKL